jgi:signal transduction histidine kinase
MIVAPGPPDRADPSTGPQFVVSIETTLEDAPRDGRSVLLERLAANLIDDATAYNVPGGWVRITTGASNGAAFLRVTNSGLPVAADDVGSLFEPFRRLDGRAEDGGGHGIGLGLSIVRAVATAHDARLASRTRPEGGLELTVVLT